jgi:hypothetical protein
VFLLWFPMLFKVKEKRQKKDCPKAAALHDINEAIALSTALFYIINYFLIKSLRLDCSIHSCNLSFNVLKPCTFSVSTTVAAV